MKYDVWERSIPQRIQADPLWSLRVYRTALYAGDLGRRDAEWLSRQPGAKMIAEQLSRSTVSISANIAEGFSRLGKRDKGRFYEFALGSARESRDWYFKVRKELGIRAFDARLELHTTLIRILIALVAKNRPAN